MTKISTILLTSVVLVTVLAWPIASADYSSIYVFGDGVCTTTASPTTQSLYFGPQQGQKRWSNGPVWTEILSPALGVPYNAAKNKSYFGHTTVELKTNAINFAAPTDAADSLFIVWTNNADFVTFATDNTLWQTNSLSTWNSKITQSINDLTAAINTLYSKGARKIVLPNAVNISAVPQYSGRTVNEKTFFRNRVIDYNNQFVTATANLMDAKPDLVIYRPDVFTYFEQVIANPGDYGFTNASIAAISLYTSFTGPGADFIFWDYWHPTTKFHNQLADFVQQSLPQPDTVPPVITLPGNLVKTVTGTGGAVVIFTTSAIDAVDGPVTTTALPASSSTFPAGTTTVNVSASDAAGNVANDSFTVTVVNMNGLLKNVSITPAVTGSPAISGQIQGGPPSGEVILQASTDLGISDPWRDLSPIQLDATGNQSFGPIQDPQSTGLKRSFFRLKLLGTTSP